MENPMEDMIAQIRQEERNNVRTDIVLSMVISKETDERIARYTKLDIEAVREIRAVWEDLVKGESERKIRVMNYVAVRSSRNTKILSGESKRNSSRAAMANRFRIRLLT